MKFRLLAGVALACVTGTTAAASDLEQKATIFGAREAIEGVSLSPDGGKVAMLQSGEGQGSILSVVNLNGEGQLMPKGILSSTGNPERIQWCRWVSNSRLLCNIYAVTLLRNLEIAYSSRLVAIDADGANLRTISNRSIRGEALRESLYGGSVIDWHGSADGHILMTREYIPERTTGTLSAQTRDGIGVDDVDLATMRSKMVETPRGDANEYISDGLGTVRIMGTVASGSGGYTAQKKTYFYRSSDARDWKPLSSVDLLNGGGFDPYGIDPRLNVAYGLDRKDGRQAAYSVSLDGRQEKKLVFAHESVDVDDFVRIGRSRRIVGVSYATDVRQVSYIDPAIEKLNIALSKSLPKFPLIRFLDSSEDEGRLVLWAGSDDDPGRYYLLDRKTNRMEELGASRPAVNFPLATMKHVRFPAADGTMIPGYLTLPAGSAGKSLPGIVLPHGGPSARDEWGFDWLVQFFASQGYAVLQPNFRGSAGYGDAWFRQNGFQNWRTAIGDVNDAGRWLVSQGIVRSDRLAVFGWSYGGYAALQSAVVEPGLFKAVVAVAPVTDLDQLRQESLHWTNYQLVSRFIGTGPHVGEGSPARHAEKIEAPVLMFHGTMDRNVSVQESRLMDDRLRDARKSSQLVIYDGLDHYLESGTVRKDMLMRSAEFFRKALGN